MIKQFGAKITKELEEQYSQSPQWKDGKFMNLEETSLSFSLLKIPGMIYQQFKDKKLKQPQKPLPVKPFVEELFLKETNKAQLIWYGHSVVLMRLNGLTILIDPMLGPNASPIAPFQTKRFSENTLDLIVDFPKIDVVLLSHDHYDHLDLASIEQLKSKTKRYIVALGVKRHLVGWGIDESLVEEMDWWDTTHIDNIKLTFTPTRHFSGRGLTDRSKSLWGGFVFQTQKEQLWFSGDGGYGDHFKAIGNHFGSFDFAFMECGQYNENWELIHMFPEQSIQAALDTNSQKIMPVHWAGFSLAPHAWNDPAIRFENEAKKQNVNAVFPEIGDIFTLDSSTTKKWWEQY